MRKDSNISWNFINNANNDYDIVDENSIYF